MGIYIFEDRINEPFGKFNPFLDPSLIHALCRSINQDTVVIDRNFRPRQAVVSVCSHGSVVGVTSLRGGSGDFRVQGLINSTESHRPIFKFNRDIDPQVAMQNSLCNRLGKDSDGLRAD
jgi:hypothetical protein